MKKLFLILNILLVANLSIYAQEQGFYPLIDNYSYLSYSGGTSNWSALEDDRGVMYFANNQGILEFDGQNWSIIECPDQSTGRSLAKDNVGKIYAGFVGDLGYLDADEKGQTRFTSLKNKLPEAHRNFKEVWNTHYLDGMVYFQTKSKIFRWDGKEMSVLINESYFQSANVINGTYYLGVWEKGLCKLNLSLFKLEVVDQNFADQHIYVIQSYAKDTLLIGTHKQGLFLSHPQGFVSFPTQADDLIKNQLYSPGLRISDDSYLLNTLGNGAIIINKKGKILQQFSKEIGLQDNTVNYTYLDSRGILWLALFNGISTIDLASPFSYLNTELGLPFKTMYDLEQHQGKLYAGTISGLFVFDPTKSSFQFIDSSYGAIYQLFTFKDRLYGAGYGMGFFEVVDDKIRFIRKNTNDDFKVTMIRQSTVDPNRIFIDWREGLVSFYFNDDIQQFQEESRTTKFHPTYKGFEVDGQDRIWMIGNQNGQVKYLNAIPSGGTLDLEQSSIVEYDTTDGLPSDLKYIFQENNNLTFLGSKAFRLNEIKNRFEETSTFYGTHYQPNTQFFSYPTQDHLGRIWVQAGKGLILKTSNEEAGRVIVDPFRAIKDFPIWNTLIGKESTLEHTSAWFNGPEGIIRYTGNPLQYKAKPFQSLIRSVIMNEDSLLYGGAAVPTIRSKIYQGNGNLVFNYAAAIFTNQDKIRYQTKLEGFDEEWSSPSELSKRTFFNLPSGKYTFKVKASNINLEESEIASYTFEIIPNWWQHWWMYLAYALGLAFLLYTIIKYSIKRSTQKLEARQKELEAIVAKRTAQIEKDKAFIEQQAQELKELDKIKSKFFANISHELRTPLTLILGPLSHILESPDEWDNIQVQKQLLVMQRNGKSLLQLIEEILDLSKLEAKKLELQEETTPLVQFFEYIFFVFEPQFQANGLVYELRLNFRENLQVLIDRRKLEKVLNNFLSNAIKFTPKKGKIVLGVSETEDLIKIQVSDTGSGIHSNDLPHIFERFYQSRQVDQKLYGGTGIGLALVQEFAALMKGKVHATSTLGSGSNFYFEFPKKEVTLQEAISLPKGEAVTEEPIDSIGSEFTIMVVEDNSDMLNFIAQLLQKKYKRVLLAQNGAEGLDLLHTNGTEIDLIVSDVMMLKWMDWKC